MTVVGEDKRDSSLKRSRRQSKITDSFVVGRAASRKDGKENDLMMVRKKSVAKNKKHINIKGKGLMVERPVRDIRGFADNEEINGARAEVFNLVEPKTDVTTIKSENVIDQDGPSWPKTPAYTRFSNLLSFHTESNEPKSGSITAVESTIKTSIKDEIMATPLPEVPAYQRFSHLLAGPRSLPLPSKFQLLDKILGAIDNLCMLAAARDQPVVFHKSLRALESSVGRRVELGHLRQLYGLFNKDGATLYKFRTVKIVHEGRRIESFAIELPEAATHEYLVNRRTDLQERLMDVVMAEHGKFLGSIDAKLPDGARLKSWHPKFDLEKVSDISAPEFFDGRNHETDKGDVPWKVRKTIELIDEEKKTDIPITQPTVESADKKSSVLERIKQKQKQADLAKMTHDPTKEILQRQYETLLGFSEIIAMYIIL